MMCARLTLLMICLLIALPAAAEILPGQTVSWTDFSHVTAIAVGREFVYFGTTEGILRYHRFEERWYDPITVSDGLIDGRIHRLTITPDDAVLTVEVDAGIYTYDITLERWFLETDFPRDYYRNSAPPGQLPLMYMPFGYEMSPRGFISDNEFRDYQITAYLADDFNDAWLGTWGMGTARVDSRDYEVTLLPYGLLQKRTDAIYRDGDSLWLAGNEGERVSEFARRRYGVTLFEMSRQKFTYFEPRFIHGFDSEIIFDIAGDEDNIYFAGMNGLTVMPRGDERLFTLARRDGLPKTETTALAVRNDSVWVGTYRGLALYTPSADTIVVVSRNLFGDLFITDLMLAGSRLIIGSTTGAYYIDFVSREVGRLRDPEGDLGGEIRHLAAFGNELLVSTDYGVTVIDTLTGISRPLPYIDAVSGAYAAAANKTYYAVAVADGLTLINRRDNDRRHHFTRDDGLLSEKITALESDGTYLWLGSEEGLTRFQWTNPDRID